MKKATTLLALLGAACLPSQAQIITSIALNNPSNNPSSYTVGTVLNYPNAAPGIDAYIRIMAIDKKNSAGGSQLDHVGIAAIDNPASILGGFNEAFQPVISSSYVNTSGLWTKGNCGTNDVKISHSANQDYQVHFRLYFKKAGTQLDTALNVNAAFLDIDGFGGGNTEREQDAFMPGEWYTLSANTVLNVSSKTTPRGTFYNALGTSGNITNITATPNGTVQVAYRKRTYIDFAMGMKTFTASAYGGCYPAVAEGRLFSASFATTCQPPYNPPCPVYTTVCIFGKVWHDANNSANGTFNNIGTAGEPGTNGGSNNFYAYVLDSASNTILGRDQIPANGEYSIADIPQNAPIKVIIANMTVAEGVTNGFPVGGSIPSGWVSTTPTARPSFRTPMSGNVYNIDFGIQKPPTANNNTQPGQPNPNNYVAIPNNAFTGTDLAPGIVANLRITGFPSGIQNLRVITGGTTTTYSSANFPSGGVTLTANTSGNPTPNYTLQIRPNTGSPTAVIPYKLIDNGSALSNAATVTKPFTTPLAVTITRFSAEARSTQSVLQWTTSSEQNADEFDLQWSTNAADWKSVGTLDSRGHGSSYEMVHEQPAQGANFYRLRIVGRDGTSEFSQVVRLVFDNGGAISINVGPNPVRDVLRIEAPAGSAATMVDAAGKTVSTHTVSAGSSWNVQHLIPGIYQITIRDAAGVVLAQERITKQ